MDFRRVARRRLPGPVFHYLDGGADDEISLARNTAAFADYELLPSQLSDVSSIDLRSTLFGQEVDWPVMIAPTGASKLFHAAGEQAVVVTVAAIRGSAPREVGAKMIVTAEATIGTIGGGQLEYQCTRIACDMLGDDETPALRKFPLGSSMGQCCGGVVDILFEPIASELPAWLRRSSAMRPYGG